MTKLDAGLMTSLPASVPGSAAVWGSKRINPRPQSCLCLAWSGCPSNNDDESMLNDLVKDLALPKYKAEILGSSLKQWNLLEQEIKISEFCHRNEKLSSFFDSYNSLCFCNDVDGLMMELGYEHKCDEWRLFIDSSKASLKAVLLHNGNIHPSIPVAHAVQLKETYETIKLLLHALQYPKYS